MATVLIVSKTQMKNGVCVGGINENTNELIRIHNERGGNLPAELRGMFAQHHILRISRLHLLPKLKM